MPSVKFTLRDVSVTAGETMLTGLLRAQCVSVTTDQAHSV